LHKSDISLVLLSPGNAETKRWVWWDAEWSFDGKLRQKYHTKNYQNLIIAF